jgi:hypothetical protein
MICQPQFQPQKNLQSPIEVKASAAVSKAKHDAIAAASRKEHLLPSIGRSRNGPGIDVIVSYFSHDLGWLDRFLHRINRTIDSTRIFVYLKGFQNESIESMSSQQLSVAVNLTFFPVYFHRLPNVGREGHTYLNHMMRLYAPGSKPIDKSSLRLDPTTSKTFEQAFEHALPESRVLVFLKDSSTKEGGYDHHHEFVQSLNLVKMVTGAVTSGLAGMNGFPPGILLGNTGMGASWLQWKIRTDYMPEWRQSNGTVSVRISELVVTL